MSHDEFLRAIAADPHDDGLRLVYADWLEDRGDQRAEYLRLEVQAIRLDCESKEYARISGRLAVLRADLDEAWTRQIGGDLYLTAYRLGLAPIIKIVREITGWGLLEASRTYHYEPLPWCLRRGVPWYKLLRRVARLNKRYPGDITFEGRPTLAGKEVKL